MNKAPAFQIYAADFLADKNVMVMSAEEVGAYWLLILVCWREGILPNDVEELAALARTPMKRFEASWKKRIARCFVRTESGGWTHQRLEKERVKQAENREKKQKAALARHHPHDADALQVQPPEDASADQAQGTSNALQSSSSSSLATAERKDSRRDGKPSKPPDVIWDLGVTMLINAGWTEPNARSFLGKQSKLFGKTELAQSISATSAANPANPHEYLVKTLQGNKNGASQVGQSPDADYEPAPVEMSKEDHEDMLRRFPHLAGGAH